MPHCSLLRNWPYSQKTQHNNRRIKTNYLNPSSIILAHRLLCLFFVALVLKYQNMRRFVQKLPKYEALCSKDTKIWGARKKNIPILGAQFKANGKIFNFSHVCQSCKEFIRKIARFFLYYNYVLDSKCMNCLGFSE